MRETSHTLTQAVHAGPEDPTRIASLLRRLSPAKACLLALLSASVPACTAPYAPAQILEFTPRPIAVRAGAAVYFGLGDALYFSRDGSIGVGVAPIWRGRRDDVHVAPDAAHILVRSGPSLVLLDQAGRALKELAPANRIFADRPAGQATYWDAAAVQWSRDSRSFFVLRREGRAVGPVTLWQYRLGDPEPRELTRIAHPPRHYVPSEGFYGSDSGDAVYYSLVENDNDAACYRYDMRSGVVSTVHEMKGALEQGALPEASRIFFNFDPSDLAGRNDADVGWAWTRSLDGGSHLLTAQRLDETGDECAVFSYAAGQLTRVLRLRKSTGGYHNGRDCGVSLDRSYYLPGSSQALVSVDTKEHKGLLVVDTEAHTYGLAPAGLEVYFAVHTGNAPGFHIVSTGPILGSTLDFARLLPLVQAAP